MMNWLMLLLSLGFCVFAQFPIWQLMHNEHEHGMSMAPIVLRLRLRHHLKAALSCRQTLQAQNRHSDLREPQPSSSDSHPASLQPVSVSFTRVCFKGKSRSGSLTSSLNFLLFLVEVSHPGCLLGGTFTVLLTGLS